MGSFYAHDEQDRPASRLDVEQPIRILQRTHRREMACIGDNRIHVRRFTPVLFPPHRLPKTYQDRDSVTSDRMGKAEDGDFRVDENVSSSGFISTMQFSTSQSGSRVVVRGVQSLLRSRTVVFADNDTIYFLNAEAYSAVELLLARRHVFRIRIDKTELLLNRILCNHLFDYYMENLLASTINKK